MQRSRDTFIGTILLVALLCPFSASSQTLRLESAGTYPGFIRTVSVHGDYACIGIDENGWRLRILDISTPQTPIPRGDLPLPGNVRCVVSDDQFAYVAVGHTTSLYIIDITDPDRPRIVGTRDSEGLAHGIDVRIPYAALANGSDGLLLYDITNPASPELRGTHKVPEGYSEDAVAWDTFALVANAKTGFSIVDFADPFHLVPYGPFDTPGTCLGVDVAVTESATTAYVADGYYGLHVFDMTDVRSATWQGLAPTSDMAEDVIASGTVAFVAGGYAGLVAVNVASGTSPVVAQKYAFDGYAEDVALDGDLVYVAGVFGGLHIVRFHWEAPPPATPTPTPSTDTDGDGIVDNLEFRFPPPGCTNLHLRDSDGDGLWDGEEDSNRNGKWDESGELKARERDTDADGYEDGIEMLVIWSDPLTPGDPPATLEDADEDALPSETPSRESRKRMATLDPDDHNPDVDGDRLMDGYEAFMTGVLSVQNPSVSPGLGDVNGNGFRDNADAQLTLNFFAYVQQAGFDANRADLDRTASVDNADSQHSLMFFARIQPFLPILLPNRGVLRLLSQ